MNLPNGLKNEMECPCCLRKVVTHKHSITMGLLRSLLKIAKVNNAGKLIRISKFLTHTETCNFQKLAYWGLARSVEKGTGFWVITERAYSFLKGERQEPKSVITFNNMVVDASEEMVYPRDVIKDKKAWMKYEDYVRNMGAL